MTPPGQSFPYVPRDPSLGSASLAPMLPLTLLGSRSVEILGLVDSGAAVSVLPYGLVMHLGLDWDRQTRSVELCGNLASVDARVAVLTALIGSSGPVRLAFVSWLSPKRSP